MHVIGASGTGKSTLLLNLILQDIENGDGVGLLDPHGDLIDEVMARIPDNRIDDVVLLDPADDAYPVGFNILSAHSDVEKNLLSSDLVAVFRRLSTSWGDQMNSVLANAILAILESTTGGTLADMRRFLIEKEFRQEFLGTVVTRRTGPGAHQRIDPGLGQTGGR
jgi:DNA helicase HerA-like ATPase